MSIKTAFFSLPLCLLSGTSLLAQGGIVWQGIDKQADAVIVQVDSKTYEVYVSGFRTVASSNKDNPPDDVGTGIGIQPGTVRKVDGTEFDDESDGEPTDASRLFPFASNLKTTTGYLADPRGTGLVWSGFHARATALVPAYHRGALRFLFKNIPTLSALTKALTGAVVAVSVNDSTGKPLKNSRLQMVKIRRILPPQILYYKFTRAAGKTAVNFAWPYAGAASQGMMRASSGSPWAAGRYGAGLRGGNNTGSQRYSCDTAWRGDLHGSLTLAWWMKQRGAVGKSASSFFQGPGAFSCFTGGVAGKSLRCVGYAPSAAALQFKVDIQKLAAKSWIHLALRLDAKTKIATLFVMGKAVETRTIGGIGGAHIGASLSTRAGLSIGAATGSNIYDLDEFRLFAYAPSNKAISLWPGRPLAAGIPYADHGDFLLTQKNNPSTVGNSSYELWVVGPPNTLLGISLGTALEPTFVIVGSTWYSNPLTILLGATGSTGLFRQPLPIPNHASLRGKTLHNQSFMLTKSLKLTISNPQATAIE